MGRKQGIFVTFQCLRPVVVNGGKLEGDVWNDFAEEPEKLAKVAKAIRPTRL